MLMKKILLSGAVICIAGILNAQNVGVGTLTPQQKLHVAGTMRVNNDFLSYQSGVVLDSMVIGNVAGAANAKLRVAGGLTRTDVLTLGGEGFPNKMFSVYGDAQVTGNTLLTSLNVTGSGTISGNSRIDGRIGINGPTSASYGLLVNSANSYFHGDAVITGNKRVNGRVGINGATNTNYGLMINNAHSYLQGSVNVFNDAVVNGNTRIDGRMGINGATNANYGLIVNNAHSYFQGNLTVTGNLNVQGAPDLSSTGSVVSNGSSSIRISFINYHINKVLFGNEDGYDTFDIPEFGSNVDDIRVSIFQYVDGYDDPIISDPKEFHWWISDVNPDNNTARIRTRNLAGSARALRGDFYLMVMIRD
jgi:hypothetical protein